MSLLGIFGFGFVDLWRFGELVGTIALADVVTDFIDGLLGQIDRVGTHIGDQTGGAIPSIDAFVELLGDAHGALGGEAQFAPCFLLQGGRDEGGRGITLALLFLDFFNLQFAGGGGLDLLFGIAGIMFIIDTELAELFFLVVGQSGGETFLVLGDIRIDRPVLARLEYFDSLFAFHDHTQRRALHPAGGKAAANLFP